MKLFLFTSDEGEAFRAQQAGVFSAIVDWERLGKETRQAGHGFEINGDTDADAARVAAAVQMPVTVRINRLHEGSAGEVERALTAGARIIMLPLARNPEEVEQFLKLVGNRARTLIQIETQELVEQCAQLRALDWDFVHIGLNDLRISRGSDWLWEPLFDGTIEQVCRTLAGRSVGFGGGTIVGGGAPIPFIHLLREMARLDCGMCILRRSFKADVAGREWHAELEAFRALFTAAQARSPRAARADAEYLREVLTDCRPEVTVEVPLA